MTPADLEDRLRGDLAAEAARTQATMLRPLAEPGGVPRRALLPRATRRWLAPAFATVAVAAVLAGVTLTGSGLGSRPHPGATPGAARAIPRFYVSATEGLHPRIAIHDSVTGLVLNSETLPGPPAPNPAIAAAANDRRFAIAVTLEPAHAPVSVGLYTLIIGGNGRVERLVFDGKLAVAGKDDVVLGIALSPDGRKLAVAVSESGPGSGPQGEIEVFKGHKLTGIWAGRLGVARDLAWLAGGRYLGFLWWDLRGGLPVHATQTRERLLDTAAPGHNLLASSKVLATGVRGAPLDTAVLSADGRTLLGTWYRNIPGTHGRGVAVVSFGRVGLHGRRPAVIAHRVIRYRGPGPELTADLSCRVLSVGGRDSAALLGCPVLERFQDGHFASLPSLGPDPIVAW